MRAQDKEHRPNSITSTEGDNKCKSRQQGALNNGSLYLDENLSRSMHVVDPIRIIMVLPMLMFIPVVE